MENFITGFPGREYQIRKALADVLGKEKAQFFFDKACSSPLLVLTLTEYCLLASTDRTS